MLGSQSEGLAKNANTPLRVPDRTPSHARAFDRFRANQQRSNHATSDSENCGPVDERARAAQSRLVAKMKQNTTPKEAVWKALLELEPKRAQMEEPDVPRLTGKFLDELQLSGFVLVPFERHEKRRSCSPVHSRRSPSVVPFLQRTAI